MKSFNSSMVQLLDVPTFGFFLNHEESFNSSMVQLLAIAVIRIEYADWVSIPVWCNY